MFVCFLHVIVRKIGTEQFVFGLLASRDILLAKKFFDVIEINFVIEHGMSLSTGRCYTLMYMCKGIHTN